MRLDDALPARVPVLSGLVAAHAAWFLGYLCSWVAVWRVDHAAVLDDAFGDVIGREGFYQVVAWVQFNAHGVPVAVDPGVRPDAPDPFTATLVGSSGVTSLLYAVPVVLLVAAGAGVAVRAESRGPVDGLVAGLTIVPGYLALAVAGQLVASIAWNMSGGAASPAAASALGRAGFLYPAVCAGLAGLAVGAVRGRTRPSPDSVGAEG